MALRISGTASEVAAYLATLGDDVEVSITTEQAPAPKAPIQAKRGPGRPKSQPAKAAPVKAAPVKEAPVKAASSQACAVIGCDNPVRSKGYCAAHYQKYNNLRKTGRAAEFGWTEDAPPQSVTNPTLPRGRAGAKAKADSNSDGVESNSEEKVVKAVPPRIRRAGSK